LVLFLFQSHAWLKDVLQQFVWTGDRGSGRHLRTRPFPGLLWGLLLAFRRRGSLFGACLGDSGWLLWSFGRCRRRRLKLLSEGLGDLVLNGWEGSADDSVGQGRLSLTKDALKVLLGHRVLLPQLELLSI
jgi:hypothetical protein